jgi:DNA-binding SARP family transcriptional activator
MLAMLVFGTGRIPALARHRRSLSLPWPVRDRVADVVRARRSRRRKAPPTSSSSSAPDLEVALTPDSVVVRRLDGQPDPGEPIQGWSCAGPIVVDVASAGGVIGVCGAGVVRAALKALTTSHRHTVIVTADCARELYGESGLPEQATVTATLDEAIGLVHAESVERLRTEEDGCPQGDVQQIWLCARADAQQARLRSLFGGAGRYGIHAVLLGYWPYGLSLTVDDDGRVLSAPPDAEQLTGSYLTTLPIETTLAEPSSTSVVADPGTSDLERPPRVVKAARLSVVAKADASNRPQLLILGPEAIKANGVELPGLLERRFSWEVATYLACHPEGAAADTIIEELWPSEPLLSARKRFTDAVYHLRRALRVAAAEPREKFVLLRMNRYRLDENMLDVDLWEFDAAISASRSSSDDTERLAKLQRAAELYCGEFVHAGDGLWAEPFRQDLRRKALTALEGAASMLERQNPEMAITMLESASRVMPWSEEADRRIMRIYQRLHRTGDVRIAYEALRERLARLGEEPSAETRELLHLFVGNNPTN